MIDRQLRTPIARDLPPIQKNIGSILLGITVILVIGCCFYINEATAGEGFALIYEWAMPTQSQKKAQMVISEQLQDDLDYLLNPMHLIYRALPHYKSKSITLGIYQEEVAGYFGVPEEETLLDLKETNRYMPVLPTPQKQTIDMSLLNDVEYLKQNFFMGGDGLITLNEQFFGQWDFNEIVNIPLRIDESIEGPKILIFHTHSKEKYIGEDVWDDDDLGIIAVGEALKKEFEEVYGIEVLHVTESFYASENNLSVTGAYERMEPIISSIIKSNPSIQVSLDLHRDGVSSPEIRLVGDYKGEPAAQIMFVNGMTQSENSKGELVDMQTLTNDYIEENLAFSLQAQIEAEKYYPELMRRIYVKAYRYSLHMLPQSLLIEIGADTNTLEEALRTVEPLAHIIAKVLQKD